MSDSKKPSPTKYVDPDIALIVAVEMDEMRQEDLRREEALKKLNDLHIQVTKAWAEGSFHRGLHEYLDAKERRPFSRIASTLRWLTFKATYEGVFEPTIKDIQYEIEEAKKAGQVVRVKYLAVAGVFVLFKVVAFQVADKVLSPLRKIFTP